MKMNSTRSRGSASRTRGRKPSGSGSGGTPSRKRRNGSGDTGRSEDDAKSSKAVVSTQAAAANTQRPLVALLDGRNCDMELSMLKDIACVAFCDARSPNELHEKVFNEAVAVYCSHSFFLTRIDLVKFKKLKLIVVIGSAIDRIDVKAAGELGIAVSNTPGNFIDDMADSTISLILNLYRGTYWLANMVSADQFSGNIEEIRETGHGSVRIRGDTLGIIGLGRVGSAVALRAKVFGFRVVAYDPYLHEGIEKSLGIDRVYHLKDLLFQSDCITLHCPLNDGNFQFINDHTITMMRAGVFFVNTSRAALVDEEALAKGLREGRIRAAAIDVYSNDFENPLERGPLKDAPNLLITPNSASYSTASFTDARTAVADEIRRALVGGIPNLLRNCVNHEYLGPPATPASYYAPTSAFMGNAFGPSTSVFESAVLAYRLAFNSTVATGIQATTSNSNGNQIEQSNMAGALAIYNPIQALEHLRQAYAAVPIPTPIHNGVNGAGEGAD